MRNTIIKSHGRTGEGISAPVFAGRGEGLCGAGEGQQQVAEGGGGMAS